MIFRRFFQPRVTFQLRNYCDTSSSSLKVTSRFVSRRLTDDDLVDSKTVVCYEDSKLNSAIGATEELLSYLGLAREYARESEHEYSDKLRRVQTIIIDLTSAISGSNSEAEFIPKTHTAELENWINKYKKELPPAEKNIIPGGGIACASLHVARAICRRTERVVVPLVKSGHLHEEAVIYLNRLSDFLFVIARIASKLDKRSESVYIPKPDGKNTQ